MTTGTATQPLPRPSNGAAPGPAKAGQPCLDAEPIRSGHHRGTRTTCQKKATAWLRWLCILSHSAACEHAPNRFQAARLADRRSAHHSFSPAALVPFFMTNKRNTMRLTVAPVIAADAGGLRLAAGAAVGARRSCYKPSMSSYSEPSAPSRPFKPYPPPSRPACNGRSTGIYGARWRTWKSSSATYSRRTRPPTPTPRGRGQIRQVRIEEE